MNGKGNSPSIYGPAGSRLLDEFPSNPHDDPLYPKRKSVKPLLYNVGSFGNIGSKNRASAESPATGVRSPFQAIGNDESKDPPPVPLPKESPSNSDLADQVRFLTRLVLEQQERAEAKPGVEENSVPLGNSVPPPSAADLQIKKLQDEVAALRLLVPQESARKPVLDGPTRDTPANLPELRTENLVRLLQDHQIQQNPMFYVLLESLGIASAKVPPKHLLPPRRSLSSTLPI